MCKSEKTTIVLLFCFFLHMITNYDVDNRPRCSEFRQVCTVPSIDDKVQSEPLNRLSYTLSMQYNAVQLRGKVSTRCRLTTLRRQHTTRAAKETSMHKPQISRNVRCNTAGVDGPRHLKCTKQLHSYHMILFTLGTNVLQN